APRRGDRAGRPPVLRRVAVPPRVQVAARAARSAVPRVRGGVAGARAGASGRREGVLGQRGDKGLAHDRDVTRASEVERRRLNDTFAELCAVRSVFGEERAIADLLTARLTEVGAEVFEDDSAVMSGAGSGNLLARLPGEGSRSVLLCAHMD